MNDRQQPFGRPIRCLLIGLVLVLALYPLSASAQARLEEPVPTALSTQTGPQIFNGNCSGCHGKTLADERGPSLLSERLLSETDGALAEKITKGAVANGMPAFGSLYSEGQISQVVAYMRLQAAALKGKPTFVADPDGQTIKSQKQAFKIQVLTRGLDTPWGLTFLPDGRMLVTERAGRLRLISKDGKLAPEPVIGTPTPWVRQDAGMLDVAAHPQYAKNGWIYLSYAELAPGAVAPPTPAPGTSPFRAPNAPSMTVVVRGKIRNNQWVESQEIFRAPAALYTTSGAHYGSRFLFDTKGHLFYSLGERGEMKNAQDLSSPLGKIHRVNDDGSVPSDNPFVKTPGAIPTIWSYGHRNPQGLAWHPITGQLWESEHGPTGGDEINIIEPGKNYGWGVISMGIQPGITKTHEVGMEQPIVYYTPTLAPSGINFYSGSRYPGWKNNLFVAALAGQQLLRLETKGRQVVAQETLFAQYGRTRAVVPGPDGLLYILLQVPTGSGTGLSLSAPTPGMVIRLVPIK